MGNVDSNLLYLVSFFSAALGLLLVSVFIMYLRLVKRYLALKGESDRLTLASKEKGEQDITHAREEAKKIVEGAYKKAEELISTSQVFNDQERVKIQTLLTSVANEEVKEYKKILNEAGKVSIDSVQKLSDDIKNEVSPELGEIRQAIETQIKNASEETKAAISSAYAIVEKETDDYKKKMFSEIDKLAFSVVKELSRKVLGKAISSKEQEEMLISALEEAKRQRII